MLWWARQIAGISGRPSPATAGRVWPRNVLVALFGLVFSLPGRALGLETPPWWQYLLKPWNQPGAALPTAPVSNGSGCVPTPGWTSPGTPMPAVARLLSERGWDVMQANWVPVLPGKRSGSGRGVSTIWVMGRFEKQAEGTCEPTVQQYLFFYRGRYSGTATPKTFVYDRNNTFGRDGDYEGACWYGKRLFLLFNECGEYCDTPPDVISLEFRIRQTKAGPALVPVRFHKSFDRRHWPI